MRGERELIESINKILAKFISILDTFVEGERFFVFFFFDDEDSLVVPF